MVQAHARINPSSDQTPSDKAADLADKATEAAGDMSHEARHLVDRLVNYTKAKPVEAVAIAAGVAFIAGGLLLAPRLLKSRQGSDYERLLRQAYAEAERIRDDSTTWNRLTDWVKANAPGAANWR